MLKNPHWHTTTLRIPMHLWQRARLLVARNMLEGGVAGILRRGLETEVARLEGVPVGFLQAWREAHPQDFYGSASPEQRVACYGGRPHASPSDTAALFTLTELQQHYNTDTWNRRTAELVWQQRKHWQDRGVQLWQQPLLPPGWDEVVASHEADTDPRIVMSDRASEDDELIE